MQSNTETDDIAIVGGGICGLTTALALEQRGFTPTIYEAASEYRPVGAGILLQTNALLVFDRLGIADRIRTDGKQLKAGQIRSPNGQILKRFDLNEVERPEFGYGFVAIHRADLQRILLDELDTTVETGMACNSVTETDPPAVQFEDGTQIRPDVVIGADGINSAVRDAVAPGVEPQALDSIVYRALVTIDVPEQHRKQGVEVWGNGSYTGGAQIDSDRFYWFGTAPEHLAGEAADPQQRKSALRDHFAECPEPIPSLVKSLDPDDVIVTALEDVPPLEQWSRGSVVLAGDAAHGMLPFAGQGAAQAIEDALALAHAIDSHEDTETAFEAYEAKRKPRAERVRSESHRLGQLGTMQSSVGCRVRNLAFRLLPDSVFRRFRRQRASNTSLPEDDRSAGLKTARKERRISISR
jgi:2-polyprenyl-6-methoxyphenol hydroxylase-like FAD-dependent oxidoreductase